MTEARPEIIEGSKHIRAFCPDCKAIAVFARLDYETKNTRDNRMSTWVLLRCGGCGRGALALFQMVQAAGSAKAISELVDFYPRAVSSARLPEGLPDGVLKEYREAELCAGHGAWRAASALLRSSLEKALKANGYSEKNLYTSIEKAAADGVMTEARKTKAHEEVRVLGNEIVHDDWFAVAPGDVEASMHYTQRVLEDLYDDRPTVLRLLAAKGRTPTT